MTDRYPEVSIKNAERQHRAARGSQKIHISKPDQPIPRQWKKYLAHGYKENLVNFFFETWKKANIAALKGVTVFLTHGEQCHSITPLSGSVIVQEIAQLTNCSHEEADTRIFLHASYIANTCENSIIIKSPDTDVLVISIALDSIIGSSRLYFHTGRDEHVRTIHVQSIKQHLGDAVTNALIGLHCFTGCDSVSAFYCKGKVKPFKLVQQDPVFCSAFQLLGETCAVSEDTVATIEAFVCSLYVQKDCSEVNEARYFLFSTANREENTMPPNKDSLLKHIQCANFQSAIYKHSLQCPDIPSPVDYGWKLHDNELDNKLEIDWMNMQPESILEHSTCTCKKSKCEVGHGSNNCCVFWGIPCTELCTCKNCCNINYCDDEEDEHTDLDEEL